MCLSSPTAQILPFPPSFSESFPSSLPLRGTTTWSTLLSTPSLSAGIASCPPGGTLAQHRHTQPELYYVLSGRGIVEIEGEAHRLTAGMTVFVPGDAEHGVRNEECGVDGQGRGELEEFRWLYVFPGDFANVEYRFRDEGAYEVKVKSGDLGSGGKGMKAEL